MIPKKPDHVKWTDAQWQAIYATGQNILVSAGAGSGKTAVLTERVIELVKQGTDINRLLVVTFTKAAALEMKERIRERLIKEISDGHASLHEQLALLDVANISTFDSFSMFVVKKYAHFLKMSSSITIGDKVALDKLKNEILEDLINERFASNDPDFYDFVRLYSKKNSVPIKSMILALAENLLKKPDFKSILERDLNGFHSKPYYESLKDLLNHEIMDLAHAIKGYINRLYALFKTGPRKDYIHEISHSFEPLFAGPNVDVAYGFVKDYKMPRLPAKVFEAEDKIELDLLRDQIKATLEDIGKLAKEPFDAFIENHQSHFKYEKSLHQLTGHFLNQYLEKQKEIGVFDFQTIAYLSVDLLANNNEVLNDLKANYDFIMVDEYQDTNPLQDRFIEMLGQDNLYLVGDIKQSIYRFRDASPELFQGKYERYLKHNEGRVIHLNQNFRSRHEVINGINTLFSKTFTKPFGGIDYDANQALEFGLTDYTQLRVDGQKYGLKIHEYYESELENFKDVWPYKTNPSKTSATVEAAFMIEDIKQKINDGYQVYDKDEKKLRPIRYEDFMILIDRKSYFETYQSLFQNANIPLFIHKEESFINHEDVLVTVSLFKLYLSLTSHEMAIKHFKYAFLSVAYSYITDVSQNDIIRFMDGLESLHPSVIFKTAKDSVFQDLIDPFEVLIKEKEMLSLSQVLIYLDESLDLLNKALKLNHVSDIEDRFLFIIERLKNFEKSDTSLEAVVEYFDYTIKNNQPNHWLFSMDIEYVKGTMVAKDHVNMMTIHKSKGLEFPVVYYPQLFSGKKSGLDRDVFYDERLGIILPFMLRGKEKTILHRWVEREAFKEDLSERIRLFYVALTRTRELMVVYHQNQKSLMPLGVYNDVDKIPLSLMMSMRRFSDLIQSVYPVFKSDTTLKTLDASFFTFEDPSVIQGDEMIELPQVEPYQYDEITLEKESVETHQYSMNPLIKGDSSLQKALELGNELHEWLENLTFHADIEPQLDTMNASPLIKSAVLPFFEQPLIKTLRHEKVYKELPFVFEENGISRRGIIDLVFETHDTMIIIDYKTKTIDKEAYTDQVKGYIRYLESKTDKVVEGYLYSLLDHTLKKV